MGCIILSELARFVNPWVIQSPLRSKRLDDARRFFTAAGQKLPLHPFALSLHVGLEPLLGQGRLGRHGGCRLGGWLFHEPLHSRALQLRSEGDGLYGHNIMHAHVHEIPERIDGCAQQRGGRATPLQPVLDHDSIRTFSCHASEQPLLELAVGHPPGRRDRDSLHRKERVPSRKIHHMGVLNILPRLPQLRHQLGQRRRLIQLA